MPPPDFALTLERHGRRSAVLVLGGELDLYRAPAIENALAEATGFVVNGDGDGATGAVDRGPGDEDAPALIVDLRSVSFLDSTTLALLLSASRRLRAEGGEFCVLVGPKTPTTVFEVTGFDRLLEIRRVDGSNAGPGGIDAPTNEHAEGELVGRQLRHADAVRARGAPATSP